MQRIFHHFVSQKDLTCVAYRNFECRRVTHYVLLTGAEFYGVQFELGHLEQGDLVALPYWASYIAKIVP